MIATIENNATHFVHPDHLGSSNIITNSTGALEELLDYYPFGSIRLDEKTGSFSQRRKFTGQEYDTDTGLSYMNVRYQTGIMGRFIN